MTAKPAIYLRISQDRQGEEAGVTRQREDCDSLAASLGLDGCKVFIDNDLSAFTRKARPAYEALLAEMLAGEIQIVLAWHPDRLHRDPTELERYIDISEKTGIFTHTVKAGRWDLSTPAGRFSARIIGSVACYESEQKGERTKRARLQKAQAGGYNGSTRPFGYEKGGLVVRDQEAGIISEAAEQILRGVSIRSLVFDFNRRGLDSPAGPGRWRTVSLRRILVNPRISGQVHYKGEILGKAQWPAIISIEKQGAIKLVLEDPRRRTYYDQRSGAIKYLGTGIYICGGCRKHKMCGGASRRRNPIYKCKTYTYNDGEGMRHVSRDAKSVDMYVQEVLLERLSDANLLQAVVSSKIPKGDFTKLADERAALHARGQELAELFATGEITGPAYATGTSVLTDRLASLDNELSKFNRSSPAGVLLGAGDLRLKWYGDGSSASPGLPLGVKRAILDSCMAVIILPMEKIAKAKTGRGGSIFDPSLIQIEWKT